MSIDPIIPAEFNTVMRKLREFFYKEGLIEVATQHRLSILAACEDPNTIATFDYAGAVWPLPQTGQMHLEYEIMTKPAVGYFCQTTSYRQEPNPIAGRHNLIFPMMEFEILGDMNDLIAFEKRLLKYLGYGMQYESSTYAQIAQRYGVDELTHEHEMRLYQDGATVFFLHNFPFSTSPFWNMKVNMDTKIAQKCDVILSGIETIGSAERSSDTVSMHTMFHEISNGMYAKTLFGRFGRTRVEKELEKFLSLPLIKRSGGGIGITRLIRSMKLENLL